jgi:hypothetical protein
MYKIVWHYQSSNKAGIYTHHEDTATNDFWLLKKQNKILDYWLKIFCPDVKIKVRNKSDMKVNLILYAVKLTLIEYYIDVMNEKDNGKRCFQMTIEPVEY